MVLTDKDIAPYKENVVLLREMVLKEMEGSDLYDPIDVARSKDNDITYCRVLMTKKNDIKAAFEFVKKSMKWRKEFGVQDIRQSDFPSEILNYKALQLYCGDKEGNIMLVFNVKEHTRNFIPKDVLKKYIVYWVEVLFNIDKYQQATIIMNLKGASIRNIDIDIILQFLDVFKNHYPQAVAHILVIGMYWIFEAAYKIIKPLIPEEFRERLRFVDKVSVLEEYLNLEEVGPELEGSAKFDPPPVFVNYKKYVVEEVLRRKEIAGTK